jgi:hypothetical protein
MHRASGVTVDGFDLSRIRQLLTSNPLVLA